MIQPLALVSLLLPAKPKLHLILPGNGRDVRGASLLRSEAKVPFAGLPLPDAATARIWPLDVPGVPPPKSSRKGTAGTSLGMSIRSSKGPII
jgi:hypothetical protein